MSQDREIELKLLLDEGGAKQLRTHPALKKVAHKTARQVSIYYDTPDGALRNAGFSLRVRESKGRFLQTVKQQGADSAGMFDRPEWEEEVESAEPDLDRAARTPLKEHLGKRTRKRLKPLIRSEMERTTWNVSRDGAAIELVLDEGTVTGGKSSERIAEVELELKSGDARDLIEFARQLGQRAPLRLGVLTKAERGYALADGAVGRVVKAERIDLTPAMSAAEAFAAIAASCLRQFRLNETIVERTQDPSALHQARVAMRRLRSAFTFFRPIIGDQEFLTLREEVRWFTDQLGDARNLDVLLKRIPGTQGADGTEKELRRTLEAARERAYASVLETLASARLRRLMLDLVGWIGTGKWREAEMAQRPIGEFGRAQLDKRWRKVKKGGKHLAKLEIETLHRLRIEVKKLRYAVEFLASLEAREDALTRRKAFSAALEDMQEHLGELNDIETARELLQSLLAGHPKADEMLRSASRFIDKAAQKEDPVAGAEQAYGRLAEAGPFWR
nr:CHAD domain-containing protein [uncultured Sphingosinicella sp.]